MRQVIAMHGWSGDSSGWQRWKEFFRSKAWVWESYERGYGETAKYSPNWKASPSSAIKDRRVVIAHSLGLHLIDNQVLKNCTDLVLMNSFSKFIPDGIQSRPIKAALKGMQSSLGTDNEKEMLHKFLNKACFPEDKKLMPPSPITKGLSLNGRKQLQGDLQLLIESKNLPTSLQATTKVLVINGKNDNIISTSTRNLLIKDLIHHLDSKPVLWEIDNAGHSLLVPELIERVESWLNS